MQESSSSSSSGGVENNSSAAAAPGGSKSSSSKLEVAVTTTADNQSSTAATDWLSLAGSGLYIRLNAPYFVAGEQVNGEVLLNLTADVHEAERVVLYLQGDEIVEYKEGEDQQVLTIKERKLYFSTRAELLVVESGSLKKGKYKLPFCFVLPKSIPASCSVSGTVTKGVHQLPYSAHVHYIVKCQIEKSSVPAADAAVAPLEGSAIRVSSSNVEETQQQQGEKGEAEVTVVRDCFTETGDRLAVHSFEEVLVKTENPAAADNDSLAANSKPSLLIGDVQALNGLMYSVEMIVVSTPEQAKVSREELVESFTRLGCLPGGSIIASLESDHQSCAVGKPFTVTVDITNRTRRKLKSIEVELIREVEIDTKTRENFLAQETIASQILALPSGIDEKEGGPHKVYLTTPSTAQPTIKTAFASVRYKVQGSFEISPVKKVTLMNDVVLQRSTPSVKEHISAVALPTAWVSLVPPPGVKLALIQIQGAPQPQVENFLAFEQVA